MKYILTESQLKFLQEEIVQIPDDKSLEDRIKLIKNNYQEVKKMLPIILKFLNVKLKGLVSRIVVTKRNVYYGCERYLCDSFNINIILKDRSLYYAVRNDLFDNIKKFTGVDLSLYGVPLDIDFYDNEEEFQKFERNRKNIHESNREILKIRRRVEDLSNEVDEIMFELESTKNPCVYTKGQWFDQVIDQLFDDFESYLKEKNMTKDEGEEIVNFVSNYFRRYIESYWEEKCK